MGIEIIKYAREIHFVDVDIDVPRRHACPMVEMNV